MMDIYHDVTTKKEMDDLFSKAIDNMQNKLRDNAVINKLVIDKEIEDRFEFIEELDIGVFFDHVRIVRGDTNEDFEDLKRRVNLLEEEFSSNPYLSKYKIKDINEFKYIFNVYHRLIIGNNYAVMFARDSQFFNNLGLSPFRYSISVASQYNNLTYRNSNYKIVLKGNDVYARSTSNELYSYKDERDIKVNIRNLNDDDIERYRKTFILDEIYMSEIHGIVSNKEHSDYISFKNTTTSKIFDDYIELLKSIKEYISIKKEYNGKRFLKEVQESEYVDKMLNDNITPRTFELMKIPEHLLNKFS